MEIPIYRVEDKRFEEICTGLGFGRPTDLVLYATGGMSYGTDSKSVDDVREWNAANARKGYGSTVVASFVPKSLPERRKVDLSEVEDALASYDETGEVSDLRRARAALDDLIDC
jgi:hypothetical protein